MSYYDRKETFWYGYRGDLRIGRIALLIVIPFFTSLIIFGLSALSEHMHQIMLQVNDITNTTNPCLLFHANSYVVINNDWLDECKNVMRYYLDDLNFKPVSPLTDDDVVLSIDGKLPTVINNITK